MKTLKTFLNESKGYYFFPVLTFVLTLIFLKESSLFILFSFLLVFLRIITLEKRPLFLLSIGFLLFGIMTHYLVENESKLPELENTNLLVQTIPDTVKVNGDLLSFEAREQTTNERVLVNYRLSNAKEKDDFNQLTKTMIIKGKFSTQEVEGARNLNGFDYKRYLDLKRISQKVTLESLDEMKDKPFSLRHPILFIKELRRRQIVYHNKRFSPLTADYMNALLLGYRGNAAETFQLTWKSLGVAHLFSLSGMHIYFFLIVFEYLFLSFKLTQERLFRWSLVFTMILIVLTGAGPGMMRAGIQTITKKINQKFSFHLTPLDCWSCALLINVLIDPYVLLTVGGQLTYYLTFLIIFIQPIIKTIKSHTKKTFYFSLLLSWLSLPLIWYYFYEFNLLNFVLNIALTPILFLVILPLLLGSFIVSYLLPPLSFMWLEYALNIFQSIGETINQWQIFQIVTGKIPLILLVLVFMSQLIILMLLETKKSHFSKKILFCFLVTCLVPFWKYANPYGMVAFVDIGQGDALFVQLPFHKGNYLVDTGGQLSFEKEDWQMTSDTRGADYTVIPFMKSKGVNRLDGVLITHAHEDHFGDLDRISDHFKVKHILFDAGTNLQPNMTQMLAYHNLKMANKQVIKKGDTFQKKNIFLECLYPSKVGDGQNDDSLVMKLFIKEDSLLLTGDLEAEGENELMKDSDIDLNATILKVGHHGSDTSSQPKFLEKIKPQKSVISCGKNNRYGHPSKETLKNLNEVGSEVYQTATDGMVYFTWHALSKSLSEAKTIKN